MLRSVGAAAVFIGLALAAWAIHSFARAGTSALPHRPASALVESGPYRFTRNPMYTGMSIVYVGAALLANTGWPLVLLPIVLVTLFFVAVRREERYLSQAFGSQYEQYRTRVRRWL